MGFNYRSRIFENTLSPFYTISSREKHSIDNPVLSDVNSQRESYNSCDLWANYFIGKKWQLNGQWQI